MPPIRRAYCTLVLLLGCAYVASSAQCSSCRYAAWNCSPDANANASPNGNAATPAQGVAVCDAEGKIQIDDVFCDGADCACAPNRQCVSLSLGCKNLFQARNRRRCVSPDGMQARFENCGGAGGALTAVPKVNLASDWVYFRAAKQCKSIDCLAVRRFEACGVVQCGRIVVAWKDDNKYHFVVEGSRASDMQPGTFHFMGDMSLEKPCDAITNEKMDGCHSLQTRNQKNGTCDGVYLKLDQALQAQAKSRDHQLSSLSWPVWVAVVGSVIGAVASVAAVIVVVYRGRHLPTPEEEDSALLNQGMPSVAAAKSKAGGNILSEEDPESPDMTPSASDLRQRGALPRP